MGLDGGDEGLESGGVGVEARPPLCAGSVPSGGVDVIRGEAVGSGHSGCVRGSKFGVVSAVGSESANIVLMSGNEVGKTSWLVVDGSLVT